MSTALSLIDAAQRGAHMTPTELRAVRAALEAAQQETEAWEAIEAWRNIHERHFAISKGSQLGWVAVLMDYRRDTVMRKLGPSRLEALTKAAEWCRAELATIYKVEGEPIRNGDALECLGVEIRPNGDAVATVRRVQPAPRAEGSPRCALCKDSGWRRSVERGRKVPCECGARGVLANTEALDSGRLPSDYHPPMHNMRPCTHDWVHYQDATENLKALVRCRNCRDTRAVDEALARGHWPR